MKKYVNKDGEQMTSVRLSELQPISEERLAEIDAIPDEAIDYSDIPDLADDDDFWKNGVMERHETKELISIRIDSSTLDYFKQRGRGYQARINSVLRKYVQAQKLAEAKEQGRQEAQAIQ